MIKVYSKPACAQCNATYLALDKAGATYEIFDVTKDEDAMNRVAELGFFQAPVVEAGELSWSGFRPDLIQKVTAEIVTNTASTEVTKDAFAAFANA